jgi:hypothetical protein
MAMKARPAKGQDTPGAFVDFVPSHMLEKRKCEIHKMIARRAHELFEHRASVPGHNIQDWTAEFDIGLESEIEGPRSGPFRRQ